MMTRFTGRTMKRTAAMLLCGVALVAPALAQNGMSGSGSQDQTQGPPPPPPPGDGMGHGRRGGGPEQRLEMLQKELNLTPDQSTKIKAILGDGRAKMMALRDSSASQDDRRAQMMAMMKSENESIKAVLTDDQKVKFEAMEKRQRERMRERRENGDTSPPPPPPAPPQQ